jgi:hypothetical protein
MIERKGKTRWCTGDKKHTTISLSRGCDCDDGSHSDKKRQDEVGRGQGNNEVEEDYDRGACDHRLDAANARAKEAAQRWLKKDTVNALQVPGQAKASASIGKWQWRMEGGGGQRRFGDGCQRATADADKALSTWREVIIK